MWLGGRRAFRLYHLSTAIYLLVGLPLWFLSAAWYWKTWGFLGSLGAIVLFPLFLVGFPFVFWIKEGAPPWTWLLVAVALLAVQWGIGSAMSRVTSRPEAGDGSQ